MLIEPIQYKYIHNSVEILLLSQRFVLKKGVYRTKSDSMNRVSHFYITSLPYRQLWNQTYMRKLISVYYLLSYSHTQTLHQAFFFHLQRRHIQTLKKNNVPDACNKCAYQPAHL